MVMRLLRSLVILIFVSLMVISYGWYSLKIHKMEKLYPTNPSELDLPGLSFDKSMNVNLMEEFGALQTTQFSKNILIELFKYLLSIILSDSTKNKLNESLDATSIENNITYLFKNILNSSENIPRTTKPRKN